MNISAGVEKKNDSFVKIALKWLGSLVGLLVVWGVSLLICFGSIIYFQESVELAQHSASTQGTIVYRSLCVLQNATNTHPAVYGWRIVVQFTDAKGMSYGGQGLGATCRPQGTLQVNQPIAVHYLLRNPSFFTTNAPDTPLIGNLLFDVFPALWMLALAFLITPAWLWLTFGRGQGKMQALITVLDE